MSDGWSPVEAARRVKRQLWKGPRRNFADLSWLGHQVWRGLRRKYCSSDQLQSVMASLSTKSYADGSVVTVTFGARYLGNRDNQLKLFLDSFLAYTRQPQRVEFLIKVDDDDDLLFFHDVKNYYADRVNIRLFSSARGRGYEDMHIWHHDLIRHRNPSAKVHFILTEDATFRMPNWDDALVRLLETRADTFFIATPCSLAETISIFGPSPVEPVPVYWIRGDDFPIYGFDLLASISKVTSRWQGWTDFGNGQVVDQYAGSLLKIAWEKFGVSLHERVDQYADRGGVFSWSEDPRRGEIRTRTLTEFFRSENELRREELIRQILADMPPRVERRAGA